MTQAQDPARMGVDGQGGSDAEHQQEPGRDGEPGCPGLDVVPLSGRVHAG
jgi:hypothetical protein